MPALAQRLMRAALLASLLGSVGTIGSVATAAAAPLPTAPLLVSPLASSVPNATAGTMARSTLALINRDRALRRLKPLVVDSRLASLALDRARWMAARNLMTHDSAGGTILKAEQARGVRPTMAGECVGWNNATWGTVASRYMYNAWKNSPEHWTLMMSPQFTRIGIGFALRSSGHVTFGSLVFARL
jgi:uncharacterized protein YkwD